MENAFDIQSFSFQGLPFEYCSKRYRRWIGDQFCEQAWNDMHDMFSNAKSDSEIVVQIVRSALQQPDYIEENAEKLLRILMVLYQSNHEFLTGEYRTHRLDDFPLHILKELKTYWTYLLCCREYLSHVERLLGRSDYVSKTAPNMEMVEKEDFIETSKSKIQNDYQMYQSRLKCKASICKSSILVHRTIVKCIYQDPWLFPCLPALFTLDAANWAVDSKTKKAELLLPKAIADGEMLKRGKILKANRKLYKDLRKTLGELQEGYYPIRYPDRNQAVSGQNSGKEKASPETKKQEKKPDLFTRDIPFALPICNVREVAIRISAINNLSPNQTERLMTYLPNILYNSKRRWSKTLEELGVGETGKIAIDVFLELTSPEYYDCKGGTTEFVLKCKKASAKLKKCGFLDEALNTEGEIVSFLNDYFLYADIGEWLLFTGTAGPLSVDYPDLEIPFFKKLCKAFEDKLNCLVPEGKHENAGGILYETTHKLAKKMTLEQALAFFDTALEAGKPDGQHIWNAVYDHLEKTMKEMPPSMQRDKVTDQRLLSVFWKEAGKLVGGAGVNVLFRTFLYVYHVGEVSKK